MPLPAVAVAGLIAFGILAKHSNNVSNAPTSGAGGEPVDESGSSPTPLSPAASGSIMSPDTAYRLIQSGAFSQVLDGAMISKWFSWREFFASSSLTTAAAKQRVPLSAYQNAAKHARNLDRVREIYGLPMSIVSWYRPTSKTSHGVGSGTDFGVSWDTANAIFRAFIKAGWEGGLGKSTAPSSVNRLHADSWSGVAARPPGALVTWGYTSGPSGYWYNASLAQLKESAGIS